MKTVLLVAEDEVLGAKLLRALTRYSVFPAQTDEEALRTLRLTEVDLILKHAARPARELNDFIARARQLETDGGDGVRIVGGRSLPDDEMAAEEADFVLLYPFSTQHLQAVLRQADDKLRLLQEVAALEARADQPGPGPSWTSAELAWDAGAREADARSRKSSPKRSPRASIYPGLGSLPRRRVGAGARQPERHPPVGR